MLFKKEIMFTLVYISICTSSADYNKQKLHFRVIELLMYLVYIIDQIHGLGFGAVEIAAVSRGNKS